MPIPPQCQQISDELDALTARKADLQADLKGAAGNVKWGLLSQIAHLNPLIDAKRKALEACLLQNAPGWETRVVIYDFSADAQDHVVYPPEGRLWKLSSQYTTRMETRSVGGNDQIKFVQGPSFPGSAIGVSIHDAANPRFLGALFRSGPLNRLPAGAPANPAGMIQIWVPPAYQVLNETVQASLPSVPAIYDVEGEKVFLLSLDFTLRNGDIRLAADLIGRNLYWQYALTFVLAPSLNMRNLLEFCTVVPSGPGSLTNITPVPGVFAVVIALLAKQYIEPRVTAFVVKLIQERLNTAIADGVNAALRNGVPPGVVLSLRRIAINPDVITLYPAVGHFGDNLLDLLNPQ